MSTGAHVSIECRDKEVTWTDECKKLGYKSLHREWWCELRIEMRLIHLKWKKVWLMWLMVETNHRKCICSGWIVSEWIIKWMQKCKRWTIDLHDTRKPKTRNEKKKREKVNRWELIKRKIDTILQDKRLTKVKRLRWLGGDWVVSGAWSRTNPNIRLSFHDSGDWYDWDDWVRRASKSSVAFEPPACSGDCSCSPSSTSCDDFGTRSWFDVRSDTANGRSRCASCASDIDWNETLSPARASDSACTRCADVSIRRPHWLRLLLQIKWANKQKKRMQI